MRNPEVLYLNQQDFSELSTSLHRAADSAFPGAWQHDVAGGYEAAAKQAVIDKQEEAIIAFYMNHGIFDMRRFMFRTMRIVVDPQAPTLGPARLMAEDMARTRS